MPTYCICILVGNGLAAPPVHLYVAVVPPSRLDMELTATFPSATVAIVRLGVLS